MTLGPGRKVKEKEERKKWKNEILLVKRTRRKKERKWKNEILLVKGTRRKKERKGKNERLLLREIYLSIFRGHFPPCKEGDKTNAKNKY